MNYNSQDKFYQSQLSILSSLRESYILDSTTRGIEKENARVLSCAALSNQPHPLSFGSPLTHPNITTDFAENLLECITSPYSGANGRARLFQDLGEITSYVNYVLSDMPSQEHLWPYSMVYLPNKKSVVDIPIAKYGQSNIGLMKHLYRKGLDFRYGKAMQMISGIHYNLSFPVDLLLKLGLLPGAPVDGHLNDISALVTQRYLGVVRNFIQYKWVLPLLFGASPVCYAGYLLKDSSDDVCPPYYLDKMGDDLYCSSYATSLRLSDIGYQVKEQLIHRLQANSISGYAKELLAMTNMPCERFMTDSLKDASGEYLQMSNFLLQLESELYAVIRPKPDAGSNLRPASALFNNGVTYLEVRCLDLDPFSPYGVSQKTTAFVDVFLMYMLLHNSPTMQYEKDRVYVQNFSNIVIGGRRLDDQVSIDGVTKNHISELKLMLNDMIALAEIMDCCEDGNKADYSLAVQEQIDKMNNLSLLPSQRIINQFVLSKESFKDQMIELSGRHENKINNAHPITASLLDKFKKTTKDSVSDQIIAEKESSNSDLSFDEFLTKYLEETL